MGIPTFSYCCNHVVYPKSHIHLVQIPIAATATSAMRLKVVFVDICFLSISRVREFPNLGFG